MNILLVDDDAIDRELFIDAIRLSGKGYRVQEAQNGKEALAVLEKGGQLPDLIILDLNMPVLDGRATLREIRSRKRFRSIPVCVMSTSSAPVEIRMSYEEGANLFLVKPLDFKLLLEMLSSLLTLFGKYVSLPSPAM